MIKLRRNYHKEVCFKPSKTHEPQPKLDLIYTATEGIGVVAGAGSGSEELFWDCCCRALCTWISWPKVMNSNTWYNCSHIHLCLLFLLFSLYLFNLTFYPFTVTILSISFLFLCFSKNGHFTAYEV